MSDYLARNQRSWGRSAPEYREPGRRNWAGEPRWGIWGIPEEDVGLLPELDGKDTIELGCGTGYVSAWIARRGGRPVGIDPTWEQLESANRFQDEFGLTFPLICAPAEAVPLKDASFDVAISEYGAAIWSDPYEWVPEAARVLRPGGELIVLGNSTLLMMCVPDDESEPVGRTLLRDQFGMHRFEWPDDEAVEFHLSHGDWIRLLRANGFVIEDLMELRPAEDATTRYEWAPLAWARRWPCEEVWKARLTGTGASPD